MASPAGKAPGTEIRLQITEIFRSIQGESTYAGLPCTFVRLTGCPLRCVYCDTAYAFTGGNSMTIEEIVSQVTAFGVPLVEVTGGEPLAQASVIPLMERLLGEGFTVLLETSGALDVSRVPKQVIKIMDLKTPSSGEMDRNRWENLGLLQSHDELKFVLGDRTDYEWARDVVRSRLQTRSNSVLFSPVYQGLDLADLSAWILQDGLPVRLQTQLHKWIWGKDARGV